MKPLRYLNKYFYRYRGRIALGILFVALSNVFYILQPILIRKALDEVANKINAYRALKDIAQQVTFYDEVVRNVLLFCLLVLGVMLMRGLFLFLMRQTIIVISRHIEYDMKNDIYDHYQKLSASFYSVNNTGDLMNRISEDVSRVRMYVGPALMYIVNMVVMFVFTIYSMLHSDVFLTLVVLAPLPILILIAYYVHTIINEKSELVQEKLSDLSTFVQESFSGIRILKAFARENQFSKNFAKQSDAYRKESLDLARINAYFFPSLILLIGLSSVLCVYVGGLEVINKKITIGTIAEFIMYINMLTFPVASLGWVISLIQRAAASQQRINEFLFTKPEIVSNEIKSTEIKGNIEFRNVSFLFHNSGIRALNQISFKVNAGKSVAFIGKTGCGKSTIANLLLRIYDVTQGEILIDGIDIRSINLNSLRNQVGYVPQEVFLFSDSIAANISFGLKDEKLSEGLRKRVEDAVRDAAIYDNIMEFEKGFETLLGERGINLSGGQKQRVSIARAIIKEPKILIFDDVLSAVDTHTEEQILNNLRRIMKDRTTIIISHRVSSVKNADQIIVMDDGNIIEQGTHAELILSKGFYFDLYEKQLVEEEVN
ncbi:MAG: ABC transporter ATP-binding protein [Bacteroidia bacterium]